MWAITVVSHIVVLMTKTMRLSLPRITYISRKKRCSVLLEYKHLTPNCRHSLKMLVNIRKNFSEWVLHIYVLIYMRVEGVIFNGYDRVSTKTKDRQVSLLKDLVFIFHTKRCLTKSHKPLTPFSFKDLILKKKERVRKKRKQGK